MKTGFVAANTSQVLESSVQGTAAPATGGSAAGRDDEKFAKESYEATILRLDGSALDWLFRLAGEM